MENTKSFKKNLTEGSVFKQLFLFSMPFFFSNLLQALYNIADMVVVSFYRVTDADPAAVNMGGQITMIVTSLVIGFAVGGTVLIAQYLGAKRDKDLHETISTLFTTLLIAAAALTVLMIGLAYPIILAINTPVDAIMPTFWYVVICMFGNVFVFGYNAISAVLRGMGDSVRPMIFVTIACFLNIALDFLFVGPLHMGASGAALATIIAQGFSMVSAGIYLYRKKFIFDFKPRSFKIYKDKLKMLFKIGLPTSIQNVINSISFLLLLGIVNLHGLAAGNAAGYCGKLNSIAILPALAFNGAISSMAGQNIGAGEYGRAKKVCMVGLLYSLIFCVAIFTLISLFPRFFLSLFTFNTSPDKMAQVEEEMRIAVEYLNAFRYDYIVVAFQFSLGGLIIGSGHTMVTMVINTVGNVAMRVPLAYILGQVVGLGMPGIGYAVPITSACAAIAFFIYLLTGKWKKNNTLDRGGPPIPEVAEAEFPV